MNIYLLYFFKLCTGKFLYIIIPTKINIMNVVERGLGYYTFVKRAGLLIIRTEIIHKYNIITINNESSQKKIIIIMTGRHQEF